MLDNKVFLELFVKVQPNWRESQRFVEELDWRRQLEHLTGGLVEQPQKRPSEKLHRARKSKNQAENSDER